MPSDIFFQINSFEFCFYKIKRHVTPYHMARFYPHCLYRVPSLLSGNNPALLSEGNN